MEFEMPSRIVKSIVKTQVMRLRKAGLLTGCAVVADAQCRIEGWESAAPIDLFFLSLPAICWEDWRPPRPRTLLLSLRQGRPLFQQREAARIAVPAVKLVIGPAPLAVSGLS